MLKEELCRSTMSYLTNPNNVKYDVWGFHATNLRNAKNKIK
jgi:hypothetical protein